ncbi:macrophage-expressed gene 1 protein-like [Physella acuta]|uniref:macrophage-expressed gene 1 protein-like n=1 Tax=Physella acuta TaxID=109671 RepID=UPI0027DD74F0|nr:macrophage-expressed gene 1 protein-like [Physella acuta]
MSSSTVMPMIMLTLVKFSLGAYIPTEFQSDWPVGDPRRCQEQSRSSQFKADRFEVLPGIGWDNLRNLEAGMVVTYNFSKCKGTDDGQFLIPDDVFTVPIKYSRVETFAEIIDSWHSSKSLTSNTVNIHAGFSFGGVLVSGKFSYEHENIKSTQIEDKAVTVRVQLRYHRYEVKLQPDPILSPQFKSRLLNIATYLELNQTQQARYEGQLLVRDFGTHVITSVTAGAGLVKDDFISRHYASSESTSKTSILVSASASYRQLFKFSAAYGHISQQTDTSAYLDQLTHSFIHTFGGPNFRSNMTVDEWALEVDNNLVPMDRTGDPLYFFITTQTLPELPRFTVAEVENLVKESIETYYEMNTIRGCTKLDAPNFSFSANFDDGSCHSQAANLTFGGAYQTCEVSGSFLNMNPCDGLSQVNPRAGGYACPPSYSPVLLLTVAGSPNVESNRFCQRCKHHHQCCHTEQFVSSSTYSSYWCAATGPVERDSGYLFGGFYTGGGKNPITDTVGCPTGFYPLHILRDTTLCLSDDYETEMQFSVPFGGFFTCRSGNPLALGISPRGGANQRQPPPNSLKDFIFRHRGSEAYPQKCPTGYSQHLLTVEDGCSVYYCIQTGYLAGPNLPPLKRPPFMKKPPIIVDKENASVLDPATRTWTNDEKAKEIERPLELNETVIVESSTVSHPASVTPDAGTILAGVVFGALAACLLFALMLTLLLYRRHNSSREGHYRRLSEQSESTVTYGSS